ncbi:MAG: relaxase/mobilization nuclease domain-containing protein [Acutalibacteraceae bacterium]
MAMVKSVKSAIKSSEYVIKSIKYILSPETKSGDEKCVQSSFLNCCDNSIDSLVTQFDVTRFAFGKNYKILAHHYVQSFSPNEKITPELAHKIGEELAECVAPGFQIIVATHVDRDHIHNHFLINSVSLETGSKWLGNQATLKNMRAESDRLCRQYGLSVIDETTGLRGIDQATQKLAEQGKSWKVELCHALDEAKILCHSKTAFVDFMKCKGFEVTRYTDRHITFQKVGEQKKIRADTLAKQFGDYYTKENLERMMGYYSLPKPLPPREQPPPQKPFVSEFEKYEKAYIKKHPPLAKSDEVEDLRQKIRQSKNPLFFLLKVLFMLILRRHKKLLLDKRYFKLSMHTHQRKFKTKKLSVSEQLEKYKSNPIYEGNIPYSRLIHSQGENCVLRFEFSGIPKLYACPIFFSAKLYNDHAIVTIKERDRKLLVEALKLKDEAIIDRHTKRYLPDAKYNEMKKRAEFLGVQVEFLVIDKKDIDKLTKEKDRYVAFSPENGKIKLAFLPQNKDYVLHCLYPDKHQAESDDLFSVTRNSKVNTRLKSEALLNGKQMRYRTLTRVEVEELHKQTGGQEMFAVFSKSENGQEEKYNVAFKEDDEQKIDTILNGTNKPKFRR